MIRALLDTDTLSEIFKGVDETVLKNAGAYLDAFPELTFSDVSVHEVLYGLHAKLARRQIRDFLELIAVHEKLSLTLQDFQLAAEIRAKLQRAGTPIGSFDPLIAASALSSRLPLVTGNHRHFGYIQALGYPLRLLNWR